MCSMWLPAVFGEITSRCGDLLVRQPARDEAQHVDLARGQTAGPSRRRAHAMAGGAEDGLDRVAVEPAGADVGS